MQTSTLIRANAQVVTISEFAVGDVYKRVETDYTQTPKLRFGIVEDVQYNGTDAFLSCVEYVAPEYDRAGITIEDRLFDGGKELALFPAQPEELRLHLDKLEAAAAAKRKAAQEALDLAVDQEKLVDWLRERVEAGVQAPKVLTGAEAVAVLGQAVSE